jgi:hypothetical protein
LGLGKMDTLRGNRHCSVDRCEGAPVAFLADQDFCLNHFFTRCYDLLDRIELRGRSGLLPDAEVAGAQDLVDECSNQTLNVCLQNKSLTNLERARLLDILLWAGELYTIVRPSLNTSFAGACRTPPAPVRLVFAKR